MANFVQQLNIEGSTYDLHDSEFIVDTRTASGAALTGVSKAPALFDGMQITFWMSYAAAADATLNLTLADGTTTGAIPCYYSGTTRLGTNYAAGNAIRFIYRENVTIGSTTVARGWWSDANYTVSDTNYDIFGTAMDVDTAVYNYSLFAITGHNGTIAKQTNTNEAGTYWKVNSFTQSAGNGTSKKATTKGYYPYKIFYNPNNTSYTTAGGNTSTVASGTSNLDLRYTVNGTTSANIGATGAPFFLVGTIGSDGLFYLKGSQATKEWWTAGVPTTKNTNYVYWFVGVMSSAYQVRLSDRNWFLKWTGTGDNDHLIQFEPWFTVEHAESADSVPWSGVTDKPSTFTPASHTHGYISNDGAIADSVATTPASGDKIVITDASDSNKVKGAITIGSDDGKYLKHDGTWATPSSGGNYIPTSEKGAASGVATLDSNSKVPIVQSNYLYGKCSTAAGTAAKTVTIAGYSETTIAAMEGVTVFVAFAYRNTAANPTLNVSGAGAHPIVVGTYQDPANVDRFSNGLHSFTLVKASDNNYYWFINEGRDTVPEAPTTADNQYVLKTQSDGTPYWSSVTIPAAAATGTLTLSVSGWSGSGPYSHSATISGTTANSKIDLQPDSTVLAQMTADGTTALYIENNNGTLTAWAMGAAPTATLTIQYTKTEVA